MFPDPDFVAGMDPDDRARFTKDLGREWNKMHHANCNPMEGGIGEPPHSDPARCGYPKPEALIKLEQEST